MSSSCHFCNFLVTDWSLRAFCLLWLATVLVTPNPTSEKLSLENRCIDFELNKIDAVTYLSNGSLFMVSNGHYWILKKNEIPLLATARPVSKLILTDSTSNSQSSLEAKSPELTIEAAVNVRMKQQDGQCVSADQTILYSWSPVNRSMVTVFEKDVLYTTPNITSIDFFRAAKSVNWTQKIDGITAWQNMTIIFQGNSFISLKCSHGQWQQVIHKKIAEVFPGVVRQSSPDSVFIRNTEDEGLSSAILFLFFGHEFYECPVTGSDPCEGPYSLMSEFFNVDHYCPDSKVGRAETNKRFLTAIILVIVVLFSLCVVGLILYFTLKPEHFTYFVNGKLRSNYNRDNLSYEALKLQNEAAAASGVECKSVTNGKS